MTRAGTRCCAETAGTGGHVGGGAPGPAGQSREPRVDRAHARAQSQERLRPR